MIKKIHVYQEHILEFIKIAISHNMTIIEVFDDNFTAGSCVDKLRINSNNELEFYFKEDTPFEILEKEYVCYELNFPDMGRQNSRSQILILKLKEDKNKEKDMKKIDILDELERTERAARKDGMEEDRMLHYDSLTYVYIDHNTPFFNIGVNVRGAGGLDYKSGVAHFTEHMLSANPSEVDIFTKNNIFNNATTSIVDTRYYLDQTGALLTTIPLEEDNIEDNYKKVTEEISSYIEEFFYWWKLIKKHSLKTITDEELKILTKEFDRHKSVIKEEINMKNKTLERDLTKQLRYYSNVTIPEWYNSILGTEEDLDNITLDDISNFYSKYYKINSVSIAFNIPKDIILEYPELYKLYLEPKIKNLKEDLLVDERVMINKRNSVYFVNFKEEYENKLDTMEIEYAEHSRVNFLMKLPDAKAIAEEFGVPTRFVHELSITLENAIYDQVTSKLRQNGLIYGLTFWRNRNIGFNTGRSKLLLMCFTNNHEDTIKSTLEVLNNLELTIDNVITDERSVLKNVLEYNLNQSFIQFNETIDRKEFDKYFKGVNYPDYFYETFYIMNVGINGKYDTSRYEELIKSYLEEFKSKLKDVHILKCIPKSDKQI